ncbi:MAG: AsmA family protein, partial [Alphaproteobacteria bacterium]
MNTHPERFTALVLAAHGDRGGPGRNESLARHVAALAKRKEFVCVTGGVLNGEPTLEAALRQAEKNGAKQILLYPMFMSDGYFVGNILPERIAAARLSVPHKILKPFGLDSRVPLMMLENALRAAASGELDPGKVDLLVAGHGSKFGPGNADATRAAAQAMAEHSPFRAIDVAFLEEAPLILEALRKHHNRSVVTGFFSGEGMHAGDDIPAAISESGAAAIYAGPIGLDPRVPDLIATSALHALEPIAPQPHSEPLAEPVTTPMAGPAASPLPNPVSASAPTSAGASGPETYAPEAETPKVAEQARDSRATRTRRGGMSGMRFLFKAVFALILMAVLAIGAVAFLVPEDVVRDQVASLVKQQTGRDLAVKGKTSFSVFPNIGVEMEDVSISNPPGMSGKNLLSMSSLNLNLKLMPLLSRRVEVERFVLVRPVFNLQVDGRGRKNWEFKKSSASLTSGKRTAVASGAETRPRVMMHAQAGGIGGGVVQGISLGTAKIVDGTVIYSDKRTGAKQRLDAINVEFVQHGLADPLVTKGGVTWRDEDISFNGSFDDVPALLRNQLSKAVFTMTTRHGTGSFDGSLAASSSPVAKGAVNLKTSSLRALAAWLANPLPPGGGLGPVKVAGQLDLKGQRLTFTKAKMAMDGMTGNGQIAVRLKGVRPHITATLAFDKLDFNPYLLGTVTGVAPPR